MNEQIIITYGNSGIELEVKFLDSKKKPINISDANIEIIFVTPSSNKISKNGILIDVANGVCSHVLESDLTSEEGLWTSYWNCYNEEGYLTAQEAIYYFILPLNGGA